MLNVLVNKCGLEEKEKFPLNNEFRFDFSQKKISSLDEYDFDF